MTLAELELPVIPMNAIADWSGVHVPDTPRRHLERLVVPVSDLARSVEFYRRVFGFRRPSALAGVGAGELLLAARGGAEIWLRPRCEAPDEAARSRRRGRRWAFVVTNLEEVREIVWDLGVKVARDSGEPDHIFRGRSGASLYVHDPDGNEIELVERAGPRSRASQRSLPYIDVVVAALPKGGASSPPNGRGEHPCRAILEGGATP